MRSNPREVVVRAWARLAKAQQIALASIEHALKSAGLPPLAWYDALLELERAGERGLRPHELQQAMLLAQYNLSRLLDRIERSGYVARRPCDHDGRGQVIVITAAGRDLRRRMWAVYAPAIQRALGGRLSPRQVAILEALLGKLIANSTAEFAVPTRPRRVSEPSTAASVEARRRAE